MPKLLLLLLYIAHGLVLPTVISAGCVGTGEVSLTGGSTGILQICYNDKLAEVCYNHFDGFKGAASAACRQLGFTDVQNYRLSDIQYDFFIEQITCPTVSNYALYGELHILRCHFTIPKTHACSPAFIECKKTKLQEQPYNGQVYLSEDANTPKSSGIVNIYLNSTRYVICHNDLVNEFNVHIGTSICRQLGYTSGSITPYNVQIGEFKSFLDITNFMCSHNSFPCFSHCIANSTRQECKTNQIIHIDCNFDVHFIATNSSGSKSLCELSTSDLLLSDLEKVTIAFSVIILSMICMCLSSCVCCICSYNRSILIFKCCKSLNNDETPLVNNEKYICICLCRKKL